MQTHTGPLLGVCEEAGGLLPWTQHPEDTAPPGHPRGSHLYVLQSQVFPVASPENRERGVPPGHQAEDAHDGLHSRLNAEAHVVAARRERVAGECHRFPRPLLCPPQRCESAPPAWPAWPLCTRTFPGLACRNPAAPANSLYPLALKIHFLCPWTSLFRKLCTSNATWDPPRFPRPIATLQGPVLYLPLPASLPASFLSSYFLWFHC